MIFGKKIVTLNSITGVISLANDRQGHFLKELKILLIRDVQNITFLIFLTN